MSTWTEYISEKKSKQMAKIALFKQNLAAEIYYKFKLSFFIIKSVKLDLLWAADYNLNFEVHIEEGDGPIHFGTNIRERLLNKPYVNEVTLTEENPSLKYYQPLDLLKDLDLSMLKILGL